MWNYERADKYLAGGRNPDSRPVENNTRIERRGDEIAVRLHATDVVTYYKNGDIVLHSGGWQTVTTKARMNQFAGAWRVTQTKGIWSVGEHIYRDGMVLHADGTVDGAGKDQSKLRARAVTYAKNYVTALHDGKIPLPSGGDCWGCLMKDTATGKPVFGDDHILQHIDEKYYVPSLVMNAMKEFPVGPIIHDYALAKMGAKLPDGSPAPDYSFLKDVADRQLRSSVRRYVLRHLGMAA